MPRRSLPPVAMAIEGLSTGQAFEPNGPQVDDFTGERIVRVRPEPQAAPPSAQEIIDQRKHAESRVRRIVLQRVGIIKG